MFDRELVRVQLTQILEAISTIEDRFAPIESFDDFLTHKDGLMRLDSICMWIIAIGESVKGIDKRTGKNLLIKYPDVPWKRLMGMRDVLSHHYFERDAEVIYEVCLTDIPVLDATVRQIINDLAI